MNQILKKLNTLDPNNSDAVKETLCVFCQNLQKHVDSDNTLWLRGLENVISRFPRYCVSHRTTIENYLTHFLDSNNYNTVIEAAKCAHALQQVRSSSEKTENAKNFWRNQTHLLCRALHALLGALFPNAVDTYRSKGDLKGRQDNVQPNSPLSTALNSITKLTRKTPNNSVELRDVLLCTRLKNIFVFLQAMLIEIFPVAKPVQPQLILDVIVRTLSVSSGSHSSSNIIDIVGVKTQALRTLDALIACLGSNLIPYSALVFRIAMQTLRWSSENTSYESRKVRCIAYGSISKWLTTLRMYRPERRARWEDELAEHIVTDITPTTHIVQLSLNSRPLKHLSKKAKRKQANTMLQESSLSVHIPGEKNKVSQSEEMNDEVALAALECAEILLTVCGVFLKLETHKAFQERLVRECYNCEAYTDERLLKLLRALEASRSCVPPGVPPPTQYCLQLYGLLGDRCSPEITKFCSQALLNIRLHLHCSPASINYALEVPKEKQSKPENRMSKRNRAALQALLGPDKMPPDTIIEANDPEQSPNKKLRLDEAEDKISISSESENSVELCENSDSEDTLTQILHPEENEATLDENSTVELGDEIDQVDTIDINDIDSNVNSMDTNTNSNIAVENKINKDDINEVIRIGDEENSENVLVEIVELATLKENNQLCEKNGNIHEAITQLPFNVSNDTTDGADSPVSMEVAYDYPNKVPDKITVLDKIEDENLPSTNDTDDVQITCGQAIKYSQEMEPEKNKCDDLQNKFNNGAPKVNGIHNMQVEIVLGDTEKDDVTTECVKNDEPAKNLAAVKEVTVEDMLADFVDEVNEDIVPQA